MDQQLAIDFDLHRVVYDDGTFTHLTPQEMMVLRELIINLGRPVSMERLVQAVYSNDDDGGPLNAEGVIRVVVYRLRKKIPWLIENSYDVGYWIDGYTGQRPTRSHRERDV